MKSGGATPRCKVGDDKDNAMRARLFNAVTTRKLQEQEVYKKGTIIELNENMFLLDMN